jgi:hypothetical protein
LRGSHLGERSISILGMNDVSCSFYLWINEKSKENELSNAYKPLSKKSAASENRPYSLKKSAK